MTDGPEDLLEDALIELKGDEVTLIEWAIEYSKMSPGEFARLALVRLAMAVYELSKGYLPIFTNRKGERDFDLYYNMSIDQIFDELLKGGGL